MEQSNQLYILWTNADILTSDKMVMMYATNSMLNRWWGNVTVIIWGATPKLVAESDLIQTKIKIAQHAGVKFSACKACADQLGVTDTLVELDIEVLYWGQGLTDILQGGGKLITV
ncbi:MAG TPA: DsrE family protein [Clostridiales bacterium]|nr:DsrE family protein [Clostridiales bacterium]